MQRYAHTLRAVLVCACKAGPKVAAAPVLKAANQRFAFAFVALSLVAAKIIHVIARERALLRRELVGWMLSFFLQDFLLLLALRSLTEWAHASPNTSTQRLYPLRILGKIVNWVVCSFSAFISVVNITFFLYLHSEPRWHDVVLAGDSGSGGLVLSGLATLAMVLLILTPIAALLQNQLFIVSGAALDAAKWPFQACLRCRPQSRSTDHKYQRLDVEDAFHDGTDKDGKRSDVISRQTYGQGALESRVWRLTWAIFILLQFIFYALRPNEGALIFISWTAPLLPFVDFQESASILRDIKPIRGVGINFDWDSVTALDEPILLDWLPKNIVLPGFEDWYEGRRHYSAKSDPLAVSNLDQDLLPQLNDTLSEVTIKHIVLVFLESTRKDLFPLKKDNLVWQRFEEEADQQLSGDAISRLETLTSTANHLTGDFDDGFEHENTTRRGGLNFLDANTASTYTIKSMAGTMCGIWPLVADFNTEYSHHVYQPCLPQILEAFSHIDQNDPAESPWRSQYMQSVMSSYDHQDSLVEKFGFPRENTIGEEYLRSDLAKFGKVDSPDINYFGMAETVLLDYVHDAFASSKQSNERVFLTHLTSTTHHPYAMPEDEVYVPLATGKWEPLSRYVNSVGYGDRWLGKILNVLDEEGVSDETLVIVAGDHGISLPENNKPASYHNPNVGCNHIPMVLSHPKLPPIDIGESVSSIEILPTVLDLLRETGSLSDAASKAATDLLTNYEGQSLIRQLKHSPYNTDLSKGPGKSSELRSWQFVVMNPGRAMLGVRDRRRPNWRIVIPVIHNVEWQFTDLESDPTDIDSVQAFEFSRFLDKVQKRHGEEASKWAEEAAFITRWWLEENNKRYEYGPHARDSPTR